MEEIKMNLVVSSNVDSMGYDEAKKVLQVKFSTGKTYQYFGVPSAIWIELGKAVSVGSYINKFVARSYKFKKLEEKKNETD